MANEVFISYSRKDFTIVDVVKKEIDSSVGIDCWMDLNGIESGEYFKKVIIAKTKEVLKDDIGMDLYLSGARGSIDNNYKNINLTRGAVKNLQTGGYDVIKGSLMDGLDKKDMAAHSNNILMGAYPKAVKDIHAYNKYLRL